MSVIREFFLPPPSGSDPWPPQTTAQTREIGVNKATGKPYFYKPAKLQQAERDIRNALIFHMLPTPIRNKPIRLVTKWLFPIRPSPDTGSGAGYAGAVQALHPANQARPDLKRTGHTNGEYKLTRPDTDNLQKLLKDCMTDMGFWTDDSLVCSEIVEKFWADTPGIYVKIEVLDE